MRARESNPIRATLKHPLPRPTFFGAVLLGALVLPLGGGLVSSPAAPAKATGTGGLTARLAATRLAPVQAGEIVLNYRFKRPSTHFSYVLQSKRGGKWISLHSVVLKGHFKGDHSTTVKQLFGHAATRPGRYRLRLSTGGSLVSLKFSIFAARPVTGTTSVSAGGTLTCILVGTGSVKCWGYNLDGELGNASTMNSNVPISVRGIEGAIAVHSGYKHACVVFPAGTVSCWGYNQTGELGNGTLMNNSVPTTVGGLSGVATSSSGAAHTCAVLTNGDLYCWGDNEVGELGTGSANHGKPYGISNPVQVEQGAKVVSVSAGFVNTCALIEGGSIDCWGYNRDGQVGDGTVNRVRPFASPTPSRVVGVTDAISISAGLFHTCALLADGTVKCWGYLTASDFAPKPLLNSTIPQQVPGIKNATSISAGGLHTCALIAGGSVKCWGENSFGQLGNGTLLDSAKPVTVSGIRHAVSISSGSLHTCALLAGGTVKCWGGNDEGELGTGTLTQSSTPLSVVQPTK